MTVRRVHSGDVETLVSMMRRFVGETDLPLTFDELGTRAMIEKGITAEHTIMLVWENNDVLGGLVFGSIGSELSVELCAYVHKFYVEQEFRGLGVSDELLKAFDQAAAAMGAQLSFSSATAGMGERVEQLYVSLFERNGYTVLGRILVRSI